MQIDVPGKAICGSWPYKMNVSLIATRAPVDPGTGGQTPAPASTRPERANTSNSDSGAVDDNPRVVADPRDVSLAQIMSIPH